MTPEKKSLDTLLNVVRNNPPAGPLLGDDEIEQILDRAPRPTPYVDHEDHKPNRRLQMGTIAVLMLAAAGTIMLTTQDDDPQPAASRTMGATPNTARDMASLRRPDTPAAAPAPAPPIMESTSDERSAETNTWERTRSIDGQHPKAPVRAGDGAAQGRPRRGGDRDRVSMPRDPNPTNQMMPYRLTVMTSDDPRRQNNSDLDVPGIRYIELTPEEMKKLGVYQNNGLLELFGEERREIAGWVRAGKLPGYDTGRSEAIVRFRATIDTNLASIGAVPNPTPDNYSAVAPVVMETEYISTANILYRAMIYFNRSPLLTGSGGGLSDEEMDLLGGFDTETRDISQITESPSLNRLVAVHVLPDENRMHGDGGRVAKVHLWYLPTKEFIDLLPDRYRELLRREIATIAAVQREKLPLGTVCERLTGEPTFLDLCRTSSGALKDLSLSPNPARENITVNLRAVEPRTVSISLHDMSGRYLRSLFESVNVGDMANRYTTGLDGVESGAYLVVVKSDRGEQAMQRLIVR